MILVFLFLLLFSFILIIACLIILSTLRIDIKNLHIYNTNNELEIKKIKVDLYISMQLLLFNTFKIFSKDITDDKIKKINKKININKKFKNIDLNKIKGNLKLSKDDKVYIKKHMRNKNIIQISEFSLDIKFGLENVIITTILITLLSTILSVFLSKIVNEDTIKKSKYKIFPIYNNKKLVNIRLKGIFNFKIVHIIHMIFFLLKKGKIKKKESEKNDRPSNRGAYDYSYE